MSYNLLIFVIIQVESGFYFCTVKLFTLYLVSILLLSNSLKVSVVYGWYALDVASFIEQLCENKDKPQLQCNGKCYLSKMSADTSSDKEQKIPVLEWEQMVFYNTEIIVAHQLIIPILGQKDDYYLIPSTKGYSYSIFHPPQV